MGQRWQTPKGTCVDFINEFECILLLKLTDRPRLTTFIATPPEKSLENLGVYTLYCQSATDFPLNFKEIYRR